MASSRLERLFTLLATSTSGPTLSLASQQLAQVVRTHPEELCGLLAHLHPLLHSSTWETRLAAVQALTAILKAYPAESRPAQADPPEVRVKSEAPVDLSCGREVAAESLPATRVDQFNFETFDLARMIAETESLLSSRGREFNTPAQCDLGQQKKEINRKFGFTMAQKLAGDSAPDDLITEEDLKVENGSAGAGAGAGSSPSSGLSARERNRLKRAASRQKTQVQTSQKKAKKEAKLYKAVRTPTDPDEWVLEPFCQYLCRDLFDEAWEIRHGAATALREIIALQGHRAGFHGQHSAGENAHAHRAWLAQISLRLITVMAKDRFGDFVSDQVVAPVRESSAQALAETVTLMTPSDVSQVVRVILQLLANPDWQCRHGGLLGIKYILAIRQDLIDEILPVLYPAIFQGLNDSVDDVVGVAAASLIPVVRELILKYQNQLEQLTDRLWDALKIIDDLTSSTHSIMHLLSEILKTQVEYGQIERLNLFQSNGDLDHQSVFALKVVRLFPFMSHSSSLVRKATLTTLNTLTEHQDLAKIVLPTVVKELSLNLFQRAILEHQEDNLKLIEQIWNNMALYTPLGPLLMATCPMYGSWVAMVIQPPHWPLPAHLLIQDKSKLGVHQYLGGPDVQHLVNPAEKDRFVTRARYLAAKMLGKLAGFIRTPVPGMDYSKDALTPLQMFVTKILMPNLNNSSSAYQRMTMSLIVSEWYEQHNEKEVPLVLKTTFNRFLSEIPSYDETRQAASQLQNETVDYISLLKHYKLQLAPDLISLQPNSFSIDQVQMFLTQTDFRRLLGSNPKLKTKLLDSLLDRKNALVGSLNRIANDQATLTVMTQAANAGAIVSLAAYPEKMNPVIKPLMESIKRERNELLQSLSADKLVRVLEHCYEQHMLPPLEKVIKNLVNFVSTDPLVTPSLNPDPSSSANQCIVTLQIREAKSAKKSESSRSSNHNHSNINNASSSGSGISKDNDVNTNGGSSNKKSGKSSGFENALSVKDTLLHHSGKTNGQTPTKLGSKRTKTAGSSAANAKAHPSQAEIEESRRLQVQSRGAQMALEKIIRHFHAQVFIKLPKLHELTLKGVLSVMSEYQNQSPELVTCLRALEVSMPVLALDLQEALLLSVPNLVTLLKSPLASIRHMSARCLAILASIRPMAVMVCVIEQILPLFNSDVVAHRQGAIECLACIVEKLDVQVLPYIALLVVPCMGRMSDFDQDIRLLASNTFAVLIRLIPLDGAVPEPLDLPQAIVQRKAQDQRFLDQLMNIGQLEDYQLPFPIEATLRSYQRSGLNWLAFLNRYRLHGILCDDMGLGKTLQTICMLASSHFHLQQRGFRDQTQERLSLVVCPPTLCSHWVAEVHRFVGKSILQPLIYSGPLATRAELRPLFSEFNVIITSYDVVRNDVDYFGRIAWNYVILDEGHVIKNGRTKTTQAIKTLQAQHRLILSGTPIQNSVLELWSLFDFLMPGFLGSEKQFAAKYSRPIVSSRDPKCSPKDQEAGALAMEALHRQVLPFILRRMKEDVLSDLPPKITQDYYCELSQIQIKLYEDFARTQSNKHRQQGDEALNLSKKDAQPIPGNKSHIFQALQYLRKVCNHPKLVLNGQHPEFDAVMGMLQVSNSNLNDINHSGKLPALHDLLLQCGIGAQSSSNSLDDSVVVQHRALVFFQLKSMMDIVENDLLKRLMPSVTYLRLDGSVPTHARQGIVDRFNNDISYDLLLLSTSVGGLGLNLTGADTVIFVEHDWNPMKDLQAMDRAHRIGQKKVVNVYRLITRNTIEEKILGLQKFKMITANTVISSDNASLHSMATDQIFDLFSLEDDSTAGDGRNGAMDQQRQQQQGIKALLDNMPELWDERQYEDEYDLNAYISKKHASNGKEHTSHSQEAPSTSKEVHHSNNQTLN